MASRSRKRGRAGVPVRAAESRERAPARPELAGGRAAAADGAPVAPKSPAQPAPEPAPAPDPLSSRYARGRARDEAIRSELEPFAAGERPRILTIAAMVAFFFAAANVVATLTVDGLASSQGNPTMLSIVWTAILLLAGAGMLARQYWAVLGFECILGLQIVVFSLALTRVQKWWLALAMTIAVGLMGVLFWKLVRPMARLQAPQRPGSADPRR